MGLSTPSLLSQVDCLKERVMIKLFDIDAASKSFKEAEPFNHIVLDNLFEDSLLEEVLSELEAEKNWDIRNDEKIQVKWRSNWKSDSEVPPKTFSLISYLNSGDFLRKLSKVTGIDGIIPDPYLSGGGFNQINQGGTLAVHADGNWHDLMGVHRRLNLIIYLNKDWDESWGGHFEAWSKTEGNKPNQCEKKIAPNFNRTVIFKTDDFSFHGHPTPLKCPSDRSRRSLILYYYTNTRPKEEVQSLDNKHRALFHNPDDIGIEFK